jgi:hypothetical protein
MGNASVLASKLHACFDAIFTPLFLAGKTPMQALEAFAFRMQGFGILDDPAIRALGQPIDPYIDSDRLTRSSRWLKHFFLHLDRDKPPSGFLGNRRRKHLHTDGWHVSTFFQAKSAQTRQVNGLLVDMNGTGYSETAQPLPFRLELRVTSRAAPLALFFETHALEEMGESLIQIA